MGPDWPLEGDAALAVARFHCLAEPSRVNAGGRTACSPCNLRYLWRAEQGLVRRKPYGTITPTGFESKRVHCLAGRYPNSQDEVYTRAASLPRVDVASALSEAFIAERCAVYSESGAKPGVIAAFRLAVATATPTQLEHVLAQCFPRVLQVFPHATLHLLTVDQRLLRQLTLIKGLVAVQQSPERLARLAPDDDIFPAVSAQLNALLLGAQAFVEPALTLTSPYLLGVSVPRAGGLVVVLFNEAADGREGLVPLSLLASAGDGHFAAAGDLERWSEPSFDANASIAWLRWYVGRVDALSSELLDPGAVVDADGNYLPLEHMADLLTMERMFSTARNLLAQKPREELVAKLLSFTLLDCLESLPGHADRLQMYRPTTLRAALARLNASVPPDIRPILAHLQGVPERVDSVADGFFDSARHIDGDLLIKDRAGRLTRITRDRAVASYLSVVRNANHGYAKLSASPRDADLLYSHDGRVPREAADVPLIYLLDLIFDPRRTLGRTS